mgnify:CR=1 FL=1
MIRTTHYQEGFSLLELLIALVVFSIGMLAVAGLQTVSKQANFEGLQRTTASQIASGLLVACYLRPGYQVSGPFDSLGP